MNGLPRDLVDDITQQAWLELEGGDAEGVEAMSLVVSRIASRSKKQERRRRKHEVVGAHAAPRVALKGKYPTLCPRLTSMSLGRAQRSRYLTTLWTVARRIAHEPGVLLNRQLRAFLLCYEDQRPLSEVTRLLGLRTRAATIERLRRIGRKLDKVIVERLRALSGSTLVRTLGEHPEDVSEAVFNKVFECLEQLF